MSIGGVRKVFRAAAVAAVATVLLASPVLADEALPRPPRADSDLRAAVADAVLGYVYYGVFDSVAVGVERGVVTLQGSVRQPYRRRDIERRVARVEGVRAVRNQIRVQPVSFFDDRLRRELYRQIYGDSVFQRYALFADPPIHIVVENGNVTLTGIVNSRLEKVKLESIARGTLAFRVDNQVEIEGERSGEPAGKGRTHG